MNVFKNMFVRAQYLCNIIGFEKVRMGFSDTTDRNRFRNPLDLKRA